MIFGMGTDLVSIDRFKRLLDKHGSRFIRRIYTDAESAQLEALDVSKQAAYAAKRFAAKEAFSKACGTGIGKMMGFVEIDCAGRTNLGAPMIQLFGNAASFVRRHCPEDSAPKIHCSLSDTKEHAQALVIIEWRQS